MNNRTKGELLVLKSNKYFIGIAIGVLLLIDYNLFSVAADMQIKIKGGYYSYTIMTLTYLLGVIMPIAAGAFLGGFDQNVHMLDYKLTNQSTIQWLTSKLFLMMEFIPISLLLINLVGVGIDVCNHTMDVNFLLMIKRFFLSCLVWMFWGIFSFTVSLVTESPGFGIFTGVFIFFGEQYIEQYIELPWGIMWNLKSLEHYFFDCEQVVFGVVQSSYHQVGVSFKFIVAFMIFCIILSYFWVQKKWKK